MKTLVIGDLHGQKEIARAAVDTGMKLVFVGDYFDSYNRSIEDQVETMRTVSDAVVNGQATALFGNHDLQYYHQSGQRCSGYSARTRCFVNHMNLDFLLSYARVEGFLITHAGVSQRFLSEYNITLDDFLYNEQDYRNVVGARRGGVAKAGGHLWCDWSEFEPVENIKQVFGHSRYPEIREKDGNYCIDVLEDNEAFVLMIDDGQAEIVNLFDI